MRNRRRNIRRGTAFALGGLLVAAGVPAAAISASAAPVSACAVDYSVPNDWGSGFTASVAITNEGGTGAEGWTLEWDFPGSSQQVTSGWNGNYSQSGAHVTVTNAPWNASLDPGQTVSIGFNGSYSGSNPAPTEFWVNGTPCGGDGDDGGGDEGDDGGGDDPAAGSPIGFASVNGETTGGASGEEVTVSSESELLNYLGSDDAYVIRVNGSIELSDKEDVGSNTSLVGIGTSGEITGAPIEVDEAENVIIRNLTFTRSDDDAINITDGSHHVWVDHNDLSNSADGLVDVKRGSDFVTVSWNHFHDHDHTALLGHSDDNAGQDEGHLRVTYHHNWFDGTYSRHPRVRFGEPVHVFNNYYLNNEGYGVGSTMDAGVLVEANYFENVPDPTQTQVGSSDSGRLVARDNVFVDSGEPMTRGDVEEPSNYYSYDLDDADDIPSIVREGAGVGEI